MIKSSITYTEGNDWWLSRRDEDGREHYPDQIRVGSLEDPRVFVPERTCAMTESHTDDSCTVRRVMDDGTIFAMDFGYKQCSECGAYVFDCPTVRYCPSCGAKVLP